MTRGDRQALWLLLAGFSVWSAGFVLLYALQALGCAYGWAWHRPILVVAYVLVQALLAGLALYRPAAHGEPASSLSVSAGWANRAAFAAGLLVFLPVTFGSTCL